MTATPTNRNQSSHRQHTLAKSVTCTGVGLHSGVPVNLTLHPADVDAGISFLRSDITVEKARVPARYDLVTDTQLGTTIVNEYGTPVSTVEHLMAALWGCGVDNVTIELDGPEVPIMDGSSEPFVFMIENAGLRTQSAARKVIKILEPVEVTVGDSTLRLEPLDGFVMDISIDFAHKAISRQQASYDFSHMTFQRMLSRARTFGFAHEVEQLRAMGLARGGSLHNAVVIGEDGVMNREGLRFNDEFVRHKALDCVGDLLLAGLPIMGRVVGHRPGHGINNQVLHALFAQPQAWEEVAMTEETPRFPAAYMPTGASVGSGISGAVHE